MVKITSNIIWKSEYFTDQLDSICVIDKKYTDKIKDVVLVTAKSSNSVREFDLSNGKFIKSWIDKWSKPNGIANWENCVGIVERDGKYVKLYDYTSKKLLFCWGEKILEKPYGITMGLIDGYVYVIITDDGPSKSVYKLRCSIELINGIYILKLVDVNKIISFDRRTKLESVYLDTKLKQILIADESKYLIYNFDFVTNKLLDLVGHKYFSNETEGISKYKDYYICTQQSKTDNRFYFFNEEFDLVYEIKDNTNISNTDGICVFNNYLIVINRDSQVVGIKLEIIGSN